MSPLLRRLPLLAVLPLAACSSGGGGNPIDVPDGYDARFDLGGTIYNQAKAAGLTTEAQTGSADYTGVMQAATGGRDANGVIDMGIAFGTGAVGGTVSDWVSEAGEDVTGSLALSGGSYNPGTSGVTFTASGTLAFPDNESWNINETLSGAFYGADAEILLADEEGATFTVCNPVPACLLEPGALYAAARNDD